MPKFIIIIQARMGSTRLPGKVMKKLLDKEVVLWSYDRSSLSKADKVFMATSTNSENDVLEKLFIEKNISYYRGSENDLLDRYYQIAKRYKEENNLDENELNVIRITSDCPFVDTNMINDMIDFYEKNNYDYIINHSNVIIPEGSGIEIINYKSLQYLWENEKESSFREHATGMLSATTKYDDIIKKHKYIYQPTDVNLEKVKYIKLSIDTKEDYEKSANIVKYFNNYNFTYNEMLKYLESTL